MALAIEEQTILAIAIRNATAADAVQVARERSRIRDGLQVGVFSYLLAVNEANAALAV